MPDNKDLASVLQDVDQILADFEYKEAISTINDLLAKYDAETGYADDSVDDYQPVLDTIDSLLAKYDTQEQPQQSDVMSYKDALSDINSMLSKFGNNEETNIDDLQLDQPSQEQSTDNVDDLSDLGLDTAEQSLDIPANSDVSTLAKVTRMPNDGSLDPEETLEDPDKMGLIRRVPGAHLVYKRLADNNTYEELWVYNLSQMAADVKIRHSILADTQIPKSSTTSPDGSQRYELWTSGNAECMKVIGLPE